MRLLLVVPALIALSGCAELGMNAASPASAPRTEGKVTSTTTADTAPVSAGQTTASGGVIAPAGVSVAALDTASAAEKQAAAEAGAAGGGAKLGRTIASLGDATEGGLWLKTALVSAPTKGRIVDAASGKAAAVDLLPLSGGGGSRISLSAMTALGFGPVDLPELDVFKG